MSERDWKLSAVALIAFVIGVLSLCFFGCGGENRYDLSTPGQVCLRDPNAPSILVRVDSRGDPHVLIEVPCPVPYNDQVNIGVPDPDAGIRQSKDGGTRHKDQDGGDCSHGDDDDKIKCPCDDDHPCDD